MKIQLQVQTYKRINRDKKVVKTISIQNLGHTKPKFNKHNYIVNAE
jgi:hypothetical protein